MIIMIMKMTMRIFIYKKKDNEFVSSKRNNVTSMLEELNISLKDRLKDIGINTQLVEELVSAAVRVNYGQVTRNYYTENF